MKKVTNLIITYFIAEYHPYSAIGHAEVSGNARTALIRTFWANSRKYRDIRNVKKIGKKWIFFLFTRVIKIVSYDAIMYLERHRLHCFVPFWANSRKYLEMPKNMKKKTNFIITYFIAKNHPYSVIGHAEVTEKTITALLRTFWANSRK